MTTSIHSSKEPSIMNKYLPPKSSTNSALRSRTVDWPKPKLLTESISTKMVLSINKNSLMDSSKWVFPSDSLLKFSLSLIETPQDKSPLTNGSTFWVKMYRCKTLMLHHLRHRHQKKTKKFSKNKRSKKWIKPNK